MGPPTPSSDLNVLVASITSPEFHEEYWIIPCFDVSNVEPDFFETSEFCIAM